MWKDIVYSFRTLRRSPVFAAVAVLSLALGIGANTAIFSLLDQVVLRSLPVRDPETLTVLHREFAPNGSSSSDNSESVFSYPMYRDLRDRDKAFEAMVARMGAPVQLIDRGNSSSADAEIVSGNFFSALGIGAAIGRVLIPEDDGAPGAHAVAVLSHNYWVTHFASSAAVLNQTIVLNGHPFVVVGVTEARFQGLTQGQTPDLFVPIAMQRDIMPGFDAENRNIRWLNVFARLKPGEDLRQAQAATDVVYHSILQLELAGKSLGSARERDRFLNHRVELRPAAQGINALRDKWEKPLRVLMVMVGLVLLIACANVAGLLMARATGRQREIAIRLAIGAGRGALIRQLLFEGLMLALAGGAAGLLVEHWTTKALLGLLPRDAVGTWLTTGLNLQLLGFTLALSVACGLIFALLPALQATRPDLTATLKDRAGSIGSGGQPAARLRQALVTMQVALSMLLVVGAGLFSVSARGLLNADLGFRTQHLLMFSLNATHSRPGVATAGAFYRDLQERLSALPQVKAVSLAIGGPFSGSNRGGNLTVEGYQPREDEYVGSSIVAVSPTYFQSMGIPLRAGREFTVRDDAAAPKAVVVNDAFVKRYFAGRNAVGKRVMFGASNHPVLDKEIVGVVADSRSDPRAPDKATIYYPYMQWEKAERMVYYLRIAGDENRLAPAIRNAVRAADPNLPAVTIQSVDVSIRESQYTGLLIAILSSAFGILATLLAAIGLYGLVTYAVARRTGEIGVRMALGALPADVLRMILREAGTMAAVGIVIGLGAAVALSRLVASQLFGVKAADPAILAGAAALLGFIALMAAMLPAWRASRIDPLSALKYE